MSPGGKVTTSTTHTMVISPHLVTVVARGPDAMVTTQKHLGATVATVERQRPQQQHPEVVISPEADRLLDDINQIISDDNGGSLVGGQSGLPNNTDLTTLISFDVAGSGYDIDMGCNFDGIPD
ncbi:hypothetical protein [Candidatus Sororendozoicomonas aggregata]|uniref:hypothetical protein n=1 Tax=Candidatus Sororendozoicomonas aggregata TaxID=3073239 RepID=UPI002ED0599F